MLLVSIAKCLDQVDLVLAPLDVLIISPASDHSTGVFEAVQFGGQTPSMVWSDFVDQDADEIIPPALPPSFLELVLESAEYSFN